MKIVIAVLLCSCICLGEAKLQQPYNELQFNSNSVVSKRNHQVNNLRYEDKNEIDDRILISEPYKSLIQTTTRFALSNTQISKHVNVDIVMNFLNDAGYMLAKPIVLLSVVKAVAVIVGTLMLGVFFLPGAPQFIEAAWRNPIKAFGFKKYLSNGMYEKSVLAVLNTRTEELLARLGLDNDGCRQKSLCHVGEMIRTAMPQKSKAAVKFWRENFANIRLSDDPNFEALTSGLSNGTCSGVSSNEVRKEVPMCVGNFMNTFLSTLGMRRTFDE